MILRRIAENIRDQNWFVVALEFTLVVAGVVIGLQVTAWNEDRKDRADEARFLVQLHGDIELAEQLSQRVRERRLERIDGIISGLDVLFERGDRDALTDAECSAIAASHYLDITTADLAAFTELASAGRINIIRDDELRRNLIQFQQVRTSLREMITVLTQDGLALPQLFPDLISIDGRFDEEGEEVRMTISCDLDSMRKSRPFLNAASENADAYDAYTRDGLQPWSEQLTRLHAQIDRILDLDHDRSAAP